MAAACQKDILLSDENLRKAFNYFDFNRDGMIDLLDVKDCLLGTKVRTHLEKSDFREDLKHIYNNI